MNRLRKVMLVLVAVLCTACTTPIVAAAPVERQVTEASTNVVVINTPTKVPTTVPSSTPLPTRTALPTAIPLPSKTATLPVVPYTFTDTIEDSFHVAELLGLEVEYMSRCTEPVYKFKSGGCFGDIGDVASAAMMEGPYYLGMFDELDGARIVKVYFFVIKLQGYTLHHSTSLYPQDIAQVYRDPPIGKKLGRNSIYPSRVWGISKSLYEMLLSQGREFPVEKWYEILD